MASLHLRIPEETVQGVDALAVAWNVSRNEAAARVLAEGVALHVGDIETELRRIVERYSPTPPKTAQRYTAGRVVKGATR
jgi:hypothetical protein